MSVPLLTGGSYLRLIGRDRRQWQWASLLFAGAAIQTAVGFLDAPEQGTHQIGFGLLVASYVLLLGFTLRNAAHTGMIVVSVGIACNFVAIAVNQGMPVRVPDEWVATGGVTTTVTHHPESPDDQLVVLGDIILLPNHEELISFGDLILAIGLVDAMFHASRKRRGRRKVSTARRRRVQTEAGPMISLDDASLDDESTQPRSPSDPARVVEFVELDLTDEPPKPPSPIVAGVIAELDEMRRAARGRHPTALFGRAKGPLVGRYSPHEREASGHEVAGSGDDHLERFEHATVVHISGAGIEGLQREPRS
jgi:Family of unknown function (DUF5317)